MKLKPVIPSINSPLDVENFARSIAQEAHLPEEFTLVRDRGWFPRRTAWLDPLPDGTHRVHITKLFFAPQRSNADRLFDIIHELSHLCHIPFSYEENSIHRIRWEARVLRWFGLRAVYQEGTEHKELRKLESLDGDLLSTGWNFLAKGKKR